MHEPEVVLLRARGDPLVPTNGYREKMNATVLDLGDTKDHGRVVPTSDLLGKGVADLANDVLTQVDLIAYGAGGTLARAVLCAPERATVIPGMTVFPHVVFLCATQGGERREALALGGAPRTISAEPATSIHGTWTFVVGWITDPRVPMHNPSVDPAEPDPLLLSVEMDAERIAAGWDEFTVPHIQSQGRGAQDLATFGGAALPGEMVGSMQFFDRNLLPSGPSFNLHVFYVVVGPIDNRSTHLMLAGQDDWGYTHGPMPPVEGLDVPWNCWLMCRSPELFRDAV